MISNSNSTSFCTPTEALNSFDARAWGDLFNDTGVRLVGSALLNSPVFQAILNEAAGMIESACLTGQRYSPEDLALNLTGVSQQMLFGLNAKLGFWLGFSRRNPDKPISPPCIWALQKLDALENGKDVFSFQEAEAAGVPASLGMTSSDYDTLTLASDVARRYYGCRSKWIAANGGLGQ